MFQISSYCGFSSLPWVWFTNPSIFSLVGNLPSKTEWICICDWWCVYGEWYSQSRTSHAQSKYGSLSYQRLTSPISSSFLLSKQALKWDLSPMTPNGWLNVYLQLVNLGNASGNNDRNFVLPQYSSHAFIQIARVSTISTQLSFLIVVMYSLKWWLLICSLQLLDLCTLDINCLQFPYSILTASAVYHMSSDHIALSVSGLYFLRPHYASALILLNSFFPSYPAYNTQKYTPVW